MMKFILIAFVLIAIGCACLVKHINAKSNFDLQLFADPPDTPDTTVEGLKKQLAVLVPALAAAKADIGKIPVNEKAIVDIGGKIKEMDAAFLKMEKGIANLGKKHVNGGFDQDQKEVDFVKFITAIYKSKHGATEESHKVFKQMIDVYGDAKQKAAMNEGTDTQGGFLVPRAFAKEIMRVADQESVALKQARRVPLTTGYKLPNLRETSTVTVAFVNEAGAVGQSEPTITEDLIAAEKLMAYSKISNELIEDEDVGLFAYLTEIFGEAIGNKIDSEVFNGDGTNMTGVLQTSGVNSVTMPAGETFASTDFDNLSDVIAQLKDSSLINAAFYLHRSITNVLRKAKLGTGGDVVRDWNITLPTAGNPGTIWGYPYFQVEQMPSSTAFSTAFMFLGNLKNVMIGEKSRDMTIKINDSLAALTDESLFIVRKRFASVTAKPGAFSVLKTGLVS